jgi:hypothetical protein
MCVRGRPLDISDKVKLLGACPSLADCANKGKWPEVPVEMVPLLQYLALRAEASQKCTLVSTIAHEAVLTNSGPSESIGRSHYLTRHCSWFKP